MILLGIIAGIVLTFIAAPIVMVQNAAKLKEMNRLVVEFGLKRFPDTSDREGERMLLKSRLTTIKGGIVFDKASVEKARDILALV